MSAAWVSSNLQFLIKNLYNFPKGHIYMLIFLFQQGWFSCISNWSKKKNNKCHRKLIIQEPLLSSFLSNGLVLSDKEIFTTFFHKGSIFVWCLPFKIFVQNIPNLHNWYKWVKRKFSQYKDRTYLKLLIDL
jgi:hypothetical protein